MLHEAHSSPSHEDHAKEGHGLSRQVAWRNWERAPTQTQKGFMARLRRAKHFRKMLIKIGTG